MKIINSVLVIKKRNKEAQGQMGFVKNSTRLSKTIDTITPQTIPKHRENIGQFILCAPHYPDIQTTQRQLQISFPYEYQCKNTQ